jgi:prepilin-type N-terminal cleavage/methylation domain-containing protein
MFRRPSIKYQRGYSLPEIMVTIAIVGVLASIALVAFGNVGDATRLAQAENIIAQLNGALRGFGQGNWDIRTTKDDGSTTDEFKVLRTLQYKPPASSGRFDSGAPYYPPSWNPSVSSATTQFRVRWNGRNFQLLVPGTAGTGLLLPFDSSDQTAPYSFPSNFTPEPPAANAN